MLRPYTQPTSRQPATLHAPPRAILRAHVLRRDLGVRDLAGVRVDLEDLGGAHREIAQQYHLGERARMAGEARAGRRAALARRDPLGVDAFEARVLLRRRVGDDLRLTGFVQQSRLLAVDPRHELALVSDPQLAAGIERPGQRVGDFLGARRIQAAVPPHDLYLGSIALRGEGVGDARARGRALGEQLGRFGLDPRRVAQVERPERRIHRVAGDVAQGTGAEVPPTAPLERRVRGVIGAGRGGAEPQVPIDPGGRVVLFERPLDRLRPDRPVGPELDLAHRPDGAGFDPLADLPRALAGVALVPHLRRDLGLAGRFDQLAHLPQGPGERLLDAGVLAHFHRHHTGDSVRVIGRRDGDRIDVLPLFLEQHAKIFEALGLGERREGRRPLVLVHVAQCVDVRSGFRDALHVVRSHAAHADAGDVDRVAGRAAPPAEHVARDDGERDADAHVADELASRDAFPSHDATLPSRPPRARARARPPGETVLRTRT